MRLTRVSQRRGYSGIVSDGSTSAGLCVRSRFPSAHQIKKSRQRLCVRFSFASELFLKNGIARSCGLFALTLLCGNTSLSPVIAQQPQQPREGIITTFAPVVEKVAPSVVTVFTTQTVSRGQTAFSLARFSGQRLRVLRPGQR